MASIAFYISGHGFGHATRQIAVINSLASLRPDLRILVRTTVASWLFDHTVQSQILLLGGVVDTGVVQIDSLRLDQRATIARAARFYRDLDTRAAAEAALLQALDVRFVVSDAPPVACAAAAAAGIRSVVCSNFTWDWIYGAYPEAASAPSLVHEIQAAYRRASAGWRLPMHGGFQTIAPIVDVPFVAHQARRPRADVRRLLDLPRNRPLALLSFGGYGVKDLALDRLDCLDRWAVVATADDVSALPPQLCRIPQGHLYDSGVMYEDLIRAVDVVITKPGYGIIADCVANETAILYTTRGRFIEYDVLVAEMPRFTRCRFVEMDALLAGRWRAPLDALLDSPPPAERPRTDGAQVVAQMISDAL